MTLLMLATFLGLVGLFDDSQLSPEQIHGISGERSRVHWTRTGDHPARVVTWNIERGVRFDEIEYQLRALDADIVLLQEVDRHCGRSEYRDVAHDLAVFLGMNWISAGEFQELGKGRGELPCITGQAILSRAPIDDAFVVVFRDQATLKWKLNPAQPRRGGRIALAASIDGVSVFDLHLESGGNEQRRAHQLAEVVVVASGRTGPALIGGDFNNEGNRNSAMFAALGAAGFVNTMDVAAPRARRTIDWIYTRNLSGTARPVPAPDASDHDPVLMVPLPQRPR